MRKFYFKQLLTTLLLLCSSAVSAASFIVDGIAYNKKSSTEVEVTTGGTYTGDIVIPNNVTYNDVSYNVTSIGYRAFYNCTDLTSITIGNKVTRIGGAAFKKCRGLMSVTIPNSLTSVEPQAFRDCDNLKEVHISDIAAWCRINFSGNDDNPLFYGKKLYLNGQLFTDLVVPNEITEIKPYAFNYCESLKSVTFHDDITQIYALAFMGCSNLAGELKIPDKVTTIERLTFYGCSSLTSVTIGNGVTKIGRESFENCSSLTSVIIGDNVTTIEYRAFKGCKTLNCVTFGNSITAIEDEAFYNCGSLVSVTIPNSVTKIGQYAFYNCGSLDNVTLGNGIITIGNEAFYGCKAIKDVHISNLSAYCNIKFASHRSNPLYAANTLYLNGYIIRGTLTIPEDVTGLPPYAFKNCSGIRKVIIPDNVTSIGFAAFEKCENITNMQIGNGVTNIGEHAFSHCTGLTNITIPDCVTSVSGNAFLNCTGLADVTIGNSVTSIGTYAFRGCSNLTSVTIGNSVTSIGNLAFLSCNAIKEVHIKDLSAWCKIGFPTNESNPLYFAGNLYLNGELINDIVIPDEITEIKDRTFLNCKTATNLKIHNGVTKIGVAAFENCSNLKGKLTIPESVTNIGLAAFKDCTGLKMITIPNSVDIIGERAFEDCLGTLCVNCDIPDITTSSKDWFYSSKFSTVIIGDKVRNIGKYAFYNNTNLQEVIFGNSVEVVSFNAFENCKRLKAISLPPSVQYIDDYAFRGCDSITYVMSSSFTPAEVYNDIFSDATYSNATLYVPYGAKETYQETDYWNKFANIYEHFLYRKQIFDIEEIAIDIIAQPINYLDRFLADADMDGFTDVNDIVSAVNFMLEDETPASAPKKLAESGNSGECALYIEPFEICAGEKKEVEILLNNEGAGITALQFDLYLPAGFEIVNSDSVYSVALGDRTTGEQHVVPVVGKQEDGALRVLTYSLRNTLFSGTEGDVITITLQASDDVEEGEYNIKMENVVIAGPDAKKILPANSNAVITIVSEGAGNDSMSGDMDGDGIVDVADVTKVVSMILDESQSSDTGDVNGDGIVDVADITKVISVILGSDTASEAPAKAAATRAGATSTVSAEIENNELFVNITNPTFAFSAIQFDIVLPEGIEVDFDGEYYAVDLGSRTNNRRHSYPECAIQPDGSLRVVIVSMSNALYNGTEGDVAVASLKVDGLADGRYEYGIKNVTIANEKSQKEVLEAYTAELIVANGVTGIGSIDAEGTVADGAIYDLAGRKVNSTVKGGIYIQNGKKFVAE